jgi:hypothetical protein
MTRTAARFVLCACVATIVIAAGRPGVIARSREHSGRVPRISKREGMSWSLLRRHGLPDRLGHDGVGPGLRPDSAGFMVDTSIVYGPSPSDAYSPSVASDGSTQLVVWQTYDPVYYNSVIMGARVDTAGVLLDTTGFTIYQNQYGADWPSVLYDGTNFLVVLGAQTPGYEPDIYGVRVTAQGQVLDDTGFAISTASGPQATPVAARGPGVTLVTWDDARPDSGGVYAARVTPAGQVLDPDGFPVSVTPMWEITPGVAFDTANFLVTWAVQETIDPYESDVYCARVSQAGTVLDPPRLLTLGLNQGQSTSAGFDGANYLVCWSEYDCMSGMASVRAARVTPAAVLLDSTPLTLFDSTPNPGTPQLSFDGTNHLVTWTACDSMYNGDVYAARVSPAGQVLDSAGIRVAAQARDERSPRTAFSGTCHFVVWEYWDTWAGIALARVTPAGIVLDSVGIPIPQAPNLQCAPAVAYDGTNFFAVWYDVRAHGVTARGARMDQSGAILDPTGFDIGHSAAPLLPAEPPGVAFGDSCYLVAWTRGTSGETDIFAARVTPSGSLLDTLGFPVCSAGYPQEWPRVGFDGNNFLVVWTDYRNMYETDIYAARVSQSGTVLDPGGFPVSTASESQDYPSVAFDGTNYLVVWEDDRTSYDGDIYGARVTPGGRVLEPAGIKICDLSPAELYPQVVAGPDNFLVTWMSQRPGEYDFDIRCGRVTTGGTVLDPAGRDITSDWRDDGLPTPVFAGNTYRVFWTTIDGTDADVMGAELSTACQVLDTFTVAAGPGIQYLQQAAPGADEQVLVAYMDFTEQYIGRQYGTYRIWARLDPFTGIAGAETQPARKVTCPTIVRAVLELQGSEPAALLDVAGRKICDLKPGFNDLRGLSPNVYFLRREGENRTTKLIVQH